MNRDIPHSVHYCLVQKIGERSKRWPLRIVRVNWYDKVFGHDKGCWLSETLHGDYRILAAFLSEREAECVRQVLTPLRYRMEILPCKHGSRPIGLKYYCLSLEETDDLLKVCGVAHAPGCIYTFQKGKESYIQWLKRQHP